MSLLRISVLVAIAAFGVGCAAEDVRGSGVKNNGRASTGTESDDPTVDGTSVAATSSGPTTAKVITPSTPPAPGAAPASPAANAPTAAAVVPVKCDNSTDSVAATYKIALLRAPDPLAAGWATMIDNGELTPIDVLKRVIESAEFASLYANVSNEQYVTALYKAFFNRAPDGGAQGWINTLNGGGSRVTVAFGFVDSAEFATPSNAAMSCYF